MFNEVPNAQTELIAAAGTGNLPCHIVRDLMPLYVDELTEEQTSQAVELHLESCDPCRKLRDRLSQPMADTSSPDDMAEVDYLRKERAISRRKALGALCAGAAVAGLGFAWSLLSMRRDFRPDDLAVSLAVEGGRIVFHSSAVAGGQAIGDVWCRVDGDGVVAIEPMMAAKTPWRSTHRDDEWLVGEDFDRINLLGLRVLWDGGKAVSCIADDAWRARTPYVGDSGAIGACAGALRLERALLREAGVSDFTNRLQTESEPYGWTVDLGDTDFDESDVEKLQGILEAYGPAFIACVGNLGRFSLAFGPEGSRDELCIDEAEADLLAGAPVKALGETPAGMQDLLEWLGVSGGADGIGYDAALDVREHGVTLRFDAEPGANIEPFGVAVLVNGSMASTRVVGGLSEGEEAVVGFCPEDFGGRLGPTDDVVFHMDCVDRRLLTIRLADCPHAHTPGGLVIAARLR